MAESVGLDAAGGLYLLRRGVPPATVQAWGADASPDRVAMAAALGPLDAADPGVSDRAWFAMAELPTRIDRADDAVVGRVLVVEPERAVLTGPTGQGPVVVERAEARSVRVDGRPLGRTVREEASGEPEQGPGLVHARRGKAGIAVGTLLAVAGGMTFLVGVQGTHEVVTTQQPSGCWDWCGATEITEYPSTPSPLIMGIGAVGLLGAGVSFNFGAHELRLAGDFPGGWRPE
jgi:hypothetical protein